MSIKTEIEAGFGRDEIIDWSRHWSADNQHTLSQRFFSFYRKAVFSRTVHYYIERFFPAKGIFVEAGAGTSETSIRIDKHNGRIVLVAVDIVLPVLQQNHPIMDAKTTGDIFQLPFADNTIDGIWNVGVMEHFTHEQIDLIMGEFHRVLRDQAPLFLLWPGTDSVPQRMLRMVEKLINLRSREQKFQFHPDEISQIKSLKEGRAVLQRNRFRPICVDYGLRSLFAFKALVGRKQTVYFSPS